MKKVLIANRGEIALRIISSCKRLGLSSLAICSTSDAAHPHTRYADECVTLKAENPRDAYLDIEQILQIAKRHAADAIHPGYGFLSENPEFASRVEQEGIIFVGPSSETLRALGHKDQARKLAKQVDVPIAPGYEGSDQSDKTLLKHAEAIGFPLMIKARAGGGGKGMRKVFTDSELPDALIAARREAESVFGDGSLIIERYISPARHIEVQVLADSFGNAIHVFERDCSLQRRNQKLIEESPAPGLSDSQRSAITQAALKLITASQLTNAATVEFLVQFEPFAFYFLEVNTRIQVEHPVTEMVSGLDLIALQLEIAAGKPLAVRQADLQLSGAAIEARIYAEAPHQSFIPKTGEILSLPREFQNPSKNLRIDHALKIGLRVTSDYDPMLAKVIVRAESRERARKILAQKLRELSIIGVENNREFLINLLEQESFKNPQNSKTPLSTSFVDKHLDTLLDARTNASSPAEALAVALSIPFFLESAGRGDPSNPFQQAGPRTPSHHVRQVIHPESESPQLEQTFLPIQQYVLKELALGTAHDLRGRVTAFDAKRKGTTVFAVEVLTDHQGETASHAFVIDIALAAPPGSGTSGELQVDIGAEKHLVHFAADKTSFDEIKPLIFSFRGHEYKTFSRLLAPEAQDTETSEQVVAHLPGTVIDVRVKRDSQVSTGDPLVIIESMKMEHALNAPHEATIEQVFVEKGSRVEEGQLLLQFK